MHQYIIRRLLQMVFVLFFVSVTIFVVIRLVPGDPATIMLGQEAAPEAAAIVRRELGLDQPIPIQYFFWLKEISQGNFGVSWRSKQSALFLISRRFPATVMLTLAATAVGLAIALPLGILSGTRPYSLLDNVCTSLALFGIAMPTFWLGLMLMLTFAVTLAWLPPTGWVPPGEDLGASLRHLALPALTLGLGFAAPLTRFLRSGMLDVMSMDYVRTARAKGLRNRLVVMRHALKNALLPVVTVFGLFFGAMLGGSVLTESVFAWPGLGTLLVQAIEVRDYGIVQGVVIFVTLVFALVNLLVDLSYAYLDPRIRFEQAG
ncbi:MAG: ABC transporter permease [Chloroflexi bacterium]|nr:ABC transporter permease [Chloroflexota bacterium]